MSVQLFRYVARTGEGAIVRGTVRAESAMAAALDLQRRALIVTAVGVRRRFGPPGGRHQRKALHGFYRAFSVLLRSGVAMRRALAVTLTHCRDRDLEEAVRAILSDIEHGSSLSAAMARRPKEFPALHCAMIGAAEVGGVLDDVLDRIATLLDRDHVVRKRIQSALAYPALVACAASFVLFFLLVRVVPMFADMFRQLGAPLPAPTKLLLGVAALLGSPTFLAAASLIFAGLLLSLGAANSFANERIDRMRLAAPVFGPLMRMTVVARIARTLGMLLRCGVDMLSSIDAALPVCGSASYATGLRQIADGLRRGESLHQCMARSRLFEPLLLALVTAGDESGTVDRMLLTAAEYLDVEVESALTAIASLVEPALICILGLVVGLIVFSIFLPLYALIGSLA